MDTIIVGNEMQSADDEISSALKQLSFIMDRAKEPITKLKSAGALSSQNLDEKYEKIRNQLEREARNLEDMSTGFKGYSSTFMSDIDELDQFLY